MRYFILLVTLSLLSGCQLGYYGQAVKGHWSLMRQRQPVTQVLADPATDETLASRLRLSQQVLVFSGDRLGLPADGVYQDYVPLQRDAVVWNVLAAPPLSLEPRTWCYLVVGCVSYRGYFNREDAQQKADELAEQGDDAYLSGATAYSTLGWFNDPLTTPMVARSRLALVELLIHELVHRRLYIQDDTRFNESLATLVARQGTRAFMASHPALAPERESWQRRHRARRAFVKLVGETRKALQALYQSDHPDAAKRRGKSELITQLRRRYEARRERVPELAAYQGFFAGPLNNAQLNGVSDYHGWVPAFADLFQHCRRDWPCFWREVEKLGKMPPGQRQQKLEQQAWN